MEFNAKWVTILMRCVHIVSYSILIKGKPYGNITPTRGLRQGDPLSPYLFYYVQRDCQHYFSPQWSKVQIRGWLSIEVHRIFHVFFLLMTALFFVELLERSVPILKGFWRFMSKRQVKNLIAIKHLFSLAIIDLQIFKMKSRIALVPRSFNSTRSIWVFHHQQGKKCNTLR